MVCGWIVAWTDCCMDGLLHGWIVAWMDCCMDASTQTAWVLSTDGQSHTRALLYTRHHQHGHGPHDDPCRPCNTCNHHRPTYRMTLQRGRGASCPRCRCSGVTSNTGMPGPLGSTGMVLVGGSVCTCHCTPCCGWACSSCSSLKEAHGIVCVGGLCGLTRQGATYHHP